MNAHFSYKSILRLFPEEKKTKQKNQQDLYKSLHYVHYS